LVSAVLRFSSMRPHPHVCHSSQLYGTSASPPISSLSPSPAPPLIPTPMFNPLPLSRSASHEPSSPSCAVRESAAEVNGALKRSSSDSDAGRVAVAAAAAAAAASASAVSATAAYVAATTEAAGQSKEHEQQQQQQHHHKAGTDETLAARDFYPSSLFAAAAAVPAAMAAAAAMCFPPDPHVASSGPPAVATAGFTVASNDAAPAPRPAEPGAASASSIVETQPLSVNAARAHSSRSVVLHAVSRKPHVR
jgi:hypothetical protein